MWDDVRAHVTIVLKFRAYRILIPQMHNQLSLHPIIQIFGSICLASYDF